MADQRQSIYGAMAVQLLISLVIVLIAAHLYGASRREAELRRLNENLNREIVERNEAERAMRQAKEEAQIANRAKSEFLAHVSHELRTPLNAILGFSETLNLQLMGPIENPQYRQYVQHIYDSGQHLLALISDVLDITRIEANETAIHEESCDLPEVSASCFAMIRGRAQDKGIDLSTRFEPGLPQLFADLRCLKQIMINLLGNAVKFTPPGGSVICRAELASDGGIVLSISDTGIGMRPDDVPRALEPFSQLTGSATKSSDGTGLGLALVNAMVAAHDGKLDIITAPDQGTTVQIKFPENRTVQPQARAAAQ